MFITKGFHIRVAADPQYTDWICPEDKFTIGVSENTKEIETYDYEGNLVGTVKKEDRDRIMPLLETFTYAALNISVVMNYDEDNGHTLVMYAHARINVANEQQLEWITTHYP